MDAAFSELSSDYKIDEPYLRRKYVKRSDPASKYGGGNPWNDFEQVFNAEEEFRTQELERATLTDDYKEALAIPDKGNEVLIIYIITITYL